MGSDFHAHAPAPAPAPGFATAAAAAAAAAALPVPPRGPVPMAVEEGEMAVGAGASLYSLPYDGEQGRLLAPYGCCAGPGCVVLHGPALCLLMHALPRCLVVL